MRGDEALAKRQIMDRDVKVVVVTASCRIRSGFRGWS